MDEKKKKALSAAKLAANRENAKRSTGPQSAKGKRRASQNAYKHGFFGLRLFPTNEWRARDGDDYKRIFAIVWNHYAPVGDMEKICVETIAADYLRLERLFAEEAKVMGWDLPFGGRSMNGIVRYEANVRRQLAKDIERLETLQQEREAESNACEPEVESSEDTNPHEATEQATELPEVLVPTVSVSNPASAKDGSNRPPETAQPAVAMSNKQGAPFTGAQPSTEMTKTVANNATPRENGALPPGAGSLVKVVERFMEAEPSNSLDSPE
jgi:hypothetical protein